MSDVVVVWKPIQAAWRRGDFTDVWLLVKPAPGVELDLPVVEAAAEKATDDLDVDGTDEGTVGGSSIDLSTGVAVYLARTGDTDNLRRWLQRFATLLTQHGYAGEIKAAPLAYPPSWTAELERYQMTLFIAYRTEGDTQGPSSGPIPWAVPPESTRRLMRASVSWAVRADDQAHHLMLGTFSSRLGKAPDISRTADILATGVPAYGQGGLWALHRRTRRARVVSFSVPGLGVYSYADDALSWRDRLDDLLPLLREDTESIDLAMVRPGPLWAVDWFSMEANGPPMDVPPAWFRTHRDRLIDTVPDAHGVQLLTGAHLDRARDLSNWVIDQIAPDRYLVTAPDLEPWFATGVADPAVVAAARADFGDMLRWRDAA
ncbi:hypothetical protein [Nocardioides sp. zg-DK7169]|uniref:hypothetical protein n=1 Tax=Nocardioides sp. zg-DK7169 TaxID=2736600 RepID=UPI0015568C76|nr:hypothetical protein [Nocardioides sp. zg-DK7169]NPC96742.1 hypothetical protein [Nocardioides sp. zg-DK7169]